MKKQMMTKGQAGFSLVELMVVVAIIGVLAMMAVPKVNAFIAKSRQSEAKVNLSSVYTFNKNFYVEFQGYTNSFPAMGLRPEGQLRYAFGFSNAVAAPSQYTVLKGDPVDGTSSLAFCEIATARMDNTVQCATMQGAGNEDPEVPAGSDLSADFGTFIAGAGARLMNDAAAQDQWTINQSKNLDNIVDGTVEAAE